MKIVRIDLNKCNLSVNLAPRHTKMRISKIHVAETQHSCVNALLETVMIVISKFMTNHYSFSVDDYT